MKSNKYHGWQKVFRFSLKEGMKQKSYIITMIIFCAIVVAYLPVKTFFQSGSEKKDTKSKIATVMVYDESGLPIDYSNALKDQRYEKVVVDASPKVGYDEQIKKLEKSKDSKDVMIHIVFSKQGHFEMTVVKAADSSLSDKDIDKVSDDFKEYFCKAKLQSINMTKEQEAFINQSVESTVKFVGEDGKIAEKDKTDNGISESEYMVLFVLISIVTMIISFTGSTIATSVVTEKSTRVIEYLIINIKPMALLIGKILASLLLIAIEVVAMGISFLVSMALNKAIWGEEVKSLSSMFKNLSNALVGVNPVSIVLAVVIILVGILFFSILAGLAGASVSKMEEMAEGLKLFQIVLMIGCYLAIGLSIAEMAGSGNPTFRTLCTLLPFSAPFVVPASLLIGKTSIILAVISLAILIVLTVLLFFFTANVYESMILYQGKTLKLKDIIMIAKNRPSARREEA